MEKRPTLLLLLLIIIGALCEVQYYFFPIFFIAMLFSLKHLSQVKLYFIIFPPSQNIVLFHIVNN